MDDKVATVLECGTGEPSPPTNPGCYVWLPSGCLQHAYHAKTFWRKTQDEDPSACKDDLPLKFNSWCGTTDAKTTFVPFTTGRSNVMEEDADGISGRPVNHHYA